MTKDLVMDKQEEVNKTILESYETQVCECGRRIMKSFDRLSGKCRVCKNPAKESNYTVGNYIGGFGRLEDNITNPNPLDR